MKVKLLKHVMEGGGVKASVRGERITPFVKGAVVEVSDATGEKWIKAGLAEQAGAEEPVTA